MDRETAKAINSLSNKVNDLVQKLDDYFGARCDESEIKITNVSSAISEMELNQADMLLDICMLELGIEAGDLFFEEDMESDSEFITETEDGENE